ncbi:MAG TPA: DUF1993 domain-containing protein [Gemmatimonadaceae bacterium]|nr:DUF1993 domain-containing protein [Gemmatimonadaceae bacterium]
MALNAYDLSAGGFVRGLTNLNAQLAKAKIHVAASGLDEATLLQARLARDAQSGVVAGAAQHDLHKYTLAAHVHWAAEGARLAIARVLGARPAPTASDAKTFADLHQRIDGAIAYLRGIAASDLEAGLGRPIVIERSGGSVSSNGGQYLVAFAIPHFFYHVTTAYGILRNEGVPLTMGDFVGNWGVA